MKKVQDALEKYIFFLVETWKTQKMSISIENAVGFAKWRKYLQKENSLIAETSFFRKLKSCKKVQNC